jgi:ComF family protein
MPKCIRCYNKISSPNQLCAECFKQIEFITRPFCKSCCQPFSIDMKEDFCLDCMERKPYYDAVRAVFKYDEFSSKLIFDLKFLDRMENVKTYSQWMVNSGKNFMNEVDIITPVPMHINKLRKRKYNQSALIAKQIAKITGKEYISNLLIKYIDSKNQAGLNRQIRLKNIKDTFKINEQFCVTGKVILLIDDVITTGATISECSLILKKAKAKKVYALTLAKTY